MQLGEVGHCAADARGRPVMSLRWPAAWMLGDTGDGRCNPPRGWELQALADRISKTWATFARSGNPANDLIPAWPAYDTRTRATMVFNDECRVENDPNAEVRPLWRKAAIA